jgi:hypothetical protein
VESPLDWAIRGENAKKADYMQPSGKARTGAADSSHESRHKKQNTRSYSSMLADG